MTRLKLRSRTALFLVMLSAGCANLFLTLPAQNPPANQREATIPQLQKSIPAEMKTHAVPGASIAIIRNGKTVSLQAFGTKNAKTNDPVTTDTIFEAASLSKPVFAYGVLKLVDQGKLELDVPLTTYLPKPYTTGDPRLSKITARIVLSHRTGFPNWRNDDGLPIYFTPGTRFSYSGEGYIYLQKVVEQITGKPLNDYMTEAVFKPLGMTSSSYIWRPTFDALTASGHDENGKPTDKWKPDEAGAASTLNTTAKDYALFVEAILNQKGLKARNIPRNGESTNRPRPDVQNLHQARAEAALKKSLLGLRLGHRTQRRKTLPLALGRQRLLQSLRHARTQNEIRRRPLRQLHQRPRPRPGHNQRSHGHHTPPPSTGSSSRIDFDVRALYPTTRHQIVHRSPIARKRYAATIYQEVVNPNVRHMHQRPPAPKPQTRSP